MIGITPEAKFFSADLQTFRSDVCLFIQTQINRLRDKKPGAYVPDEFVILRPYGIGGLPLGRVRLDVRTQKGKLIEQHVFVKSIGPWINLQTAHCASAFFAGVAGDI